MAAAEAEAEVGATVQHKIREAAEASERVEGVRDGHGKKNP